MMALNQHKKNSDFVSADENPENGLNQEILTFHWSEEEAITESNSEMEEMLTQRHNQRVEEQQPQLPKGFAEISNK